MITGKRSLENYLYPAAIFEARGVVAEFSDDARSLSRSARGTYRPTEPNQEIMPHTPEAFDMALSIGKTTCCQSAAVRTGRFAQGGGPVIVTLVERHPS